MPAELLPHLTLELADPDVTSSQAAACPDLGVPALPFPRRAASSASFFLKAKPAHTIVGRSQFYLRTHLIALQGTFLAHIIKSEGAATHRITIQ